MLDAETCKKPGSNMISWPFTFRYDPSCTSLVETFLPSQPLADPS